MVITIVTTIVVNITTIARMWWQIGRYALHDGRSHAKHFIVHVVASAWMSLRLVLAWCVKRNERNIKNSLP